MRSRSRQHRLALGVAVAATFGGSALAHTALAHTESTDDSSRLEPVRISAMALDEDAERLASPYNVIDGETLFRHGGGTLGEALNGEPGIHVDTFGAGASRPVIRGQTAPRVSVLTDGAPLLDASDISPDHVVSAEPLLVRRAEVLRGPATLLYGGGAIGGVVNLLDDRIPSAMPQAGQEGFMSMRGDTAARERALAAGLTTSLTENLALRVEGASRAAEDYEVHGFRNLREEGTHARSQSGSLGLSWITEDGYLGAAYSFRRDNYGLPGHSHDHEGCVPEGGSLVCDIEPHDHDHGVPYVDLTSERLDVRGEYRNPMDGIERVRLRASYTDYAHDEVEGGIAGTSFSNLGYNGRLEAEHSPLGGLHGVVGVQYGFNRLSTEGIEAFLPETETQTTGLFIVEHYTLNDQWHFEGGLRQDFQHIRAENGLPSSRMNGTSASAAATWQFLPRYSLSLTTARSQRLPHAQELYANGVHLATNTYECGLFPNEFTCGGVGEDAEIKAETSHNVGLTLRRHYGAVIFNVGAFHNRVDNYIYARTLDQEGIFRLIKYTQADAEFTGAEAEATWFVTDRYALTAFGDTVRATFTDGGNLPRIPAWRAGMRLEHRWDTVTGEVEAYRTGTQNRVADYETRTPGHDMVNASLSWQPGGDERYTLFVRGSNLLREKVWHHSSFLANRVPEPGRSLSAGVRLTF